MCMLWGATPEGLPVSRRGLQGGGSSVGSLWCGRGATMVSEERPRARGENSEVRVGVGGWQERNSLLRRELCVKTESFCS